MHHYRSIRRANGGPRHFRRGEVTRDEAADTVHHVLPSSSASRSSAPPSDIAGSPDLRQFDGVSPRERDIPGIAGPPHVVSLKWAVEMFKGISVKKGIESHLRDHNLRVELRRDGEKRMMWHCVRKTDDE